MENGVNGSGVFKTIAIIPARGGSKRIPHKNIKDFCGKPILAYSIEAAIKSGVFDEVMVSTDDEEIAKVAEKYGAKIPFQRSNYTSGDYATIQDVVVEVLENYKNKRKQYDGYCCIYAAAPFVTAEQLREGNKLLYEQDTWKVVPIVRFSYPPQRSYVLKSGYLSWNWPEYKSTRSQDLEPWYHECGSFFYCRTINKNQIERVVPLIISETEVQDIDTEEDWRVAEFKYKYLNKSKDN
ncbi:CMP-N-acetylneuraminic acid synthetase [Desulfosporosinus sp. Tol-M]|nr:CMP-N-acetylneuraminic acid synthetase [Desulfosporosinus sp. Tol-M]